MSGLLAGEIGGERKQSSAETRSEISSADVRDLLLCPRFAEACNREIAATIEDYRRTPFVKRIFSDRGQYVMGMLAQYLHHVPLDGEQDAGLTVGRFRTLCAQVGIASPGRATAMLNLMRFAGYLRRVPSSSDRRRALFEPTERLLSYRTQRWRHHFEAAAMIAPEAELALQVWDRQWFRTALLCAFVETYLQGFRFVHHAPELANVLESVSGFMILLQIKLASENPHAVGHSDLTISSLASGCCASRAHVRNVLARAAADELIEARASSRDRIAARPILREAIHRFYAAAFALTVRCVRLAADRQIPGGEALQPRVG
jgi:DNA-binding MarR family transcriptional regulator